MLGFPSPKGMKVKDIYDDRNVRGDVNGEAIGSLVKVNMNH